MGASNKSLRRAELAEIRDEGSRRSGADDLRRSNLSALLDHVHLRGPTSRSQLTTITGLNRSTIADLVGELSRLGLVTERRSARTDGPGRPSPIVAAAPEGAVVLAIDLAVDSIAVATVGLGGHVFNRLRVDRPRDRFSPDETVDDAVKLAEPLLGALPDDHRFAGVGVAVVGITRRSGRLRTSRAQPRLAGRAARHHAHGAIGPRRRRSPLPTRPTSGR